MKVTTNRGKAFDVLWCWGPLRDADEVMLCMMDARPLPEIAADFDGLDSLTRTAENEKDMNFSGYSRVRHISRKRGTEEVTITLEKAVTEND